MATQEEKIAALQEWIDQSKRIVFFGGPGVSAESGILDYRKDDGLYGRRYRYCPFVIMQLSYFEDYTEDFYDYYRSHFLNLDAKPNKCHKYVANLERMRKLRAVITQSFEGLHQQAGNERVYELNGNINRYYCRECGAQFTPDYIRNSPTNVPHCDKCGGVIRPDIVMRDEHIEYEKRIRTEKAMSQGDLLIVGGINLSLYPAASMLMQFKGKYKISIETGPDDKCPGMDLVIQGKLVDIFGKLHL